MLMTKNDLFDALLDRMDACKEAGIDTMTSAATEWYKTDAITVQLKKLWDIYNNAFDHAKTAGYVGVGQITFAEAALQEAQFEPAI